MMVQRKRLSSRYHQTWPFKETMKKVGNPINLPFRDDFLPFRKNKKNSDIGDGLLGFPHWLNDFPTDMPIYLDDFPASRRLMEGKMLFVG